MIKIYQYNHKLFKEKVFILAISEEVAKHILQRDYEPKNYYLL